MATVSPHVPEVGLRARARRLDRAMWASLTIGAIWLAVLVDALFGPDIVVNNASGFSRIPSAIVFVFFAWLATWPIAKYGFDRHGKE